MTPCVQLDSAAKHPLAHAQVKPVMALLESGHPWRLSEGPWAHPKPCEGPELPTESAPLQGCGAGPVGIVSASPVITLGSQSLTEQPALTAAQQVPQIFHPPIQMTD